MYNPKIWYDGDIVTSGGLNNIEQGIAQNAHDIETINDSIEDLSADAKKTGDELTQLKSGLSEYESIFTGDVDESVKNWLDEHPEATTTVQDHSLTYEKLVNGTLGYVTPEMFGAVGDGVTDDTEAIQNAVNASNNVLFENEAIYYITDKIDLNDNQDINLNGATILLALDGSKNLNRILNLQEKSYIKIHDGFLKTDYEKYELSGDFDSQVVGIHGYGAQNCEIYRLYISNLGLESSTNGSEMISFGLHGGITRDCFGNHIYDCVLDSKYDSFGVRFASAWTSVYDYSVYDNLVENCIFKYNSKSCVEISGNTTHHCKCLNNLVLDCGTEAMDIDKNSHHCEISGNLILKCSGSDEVPNRVPYGGISVQTYSSASASVTGYYSHDNIVCDNTIVDTVGSGFYFGGAKGIIAKNNVVKSALWGVTLGSKITVDGTIRTSGIIESNFINASVYGFNIDDHDDIVISNNQISSDICALIVGHNSESCINVIGNILKHGQRGVYINRDISNVLMSDNHISETIAHENNARSIAVLESKKIRIINNTVDLATGIVIEINHASTDAELDYICGNVYPQNQDALKINGDSTVSRLITDLNSTDAIVSATLSITKRVFDRFAKKENITSDTSSLTVGSRHNVVLCQNIGKISFTGTVSQSIPNGTTLFELPSGYYPAFEQMISIDGTVSGHALLNTNGTVTVFAGSISAGTIFIDSTYIF